jgi:hypothetical protein
MMEKKRETAYKISEEITRKYKKKNLEKKIATLLMREKIVKTPFIKKIQAKLKSKNKRSNQN